MANRLFAAFAATMFLGACSAQKSTNVEDKGADAAASTLEEVDGMEFCSDATGSKCFLEMRNGGRSEFYVANSANVYWLTREGLSEVGINLVNVSDSDYQQKLVSGLFPRATYDNAVKVDLNILNEDGTNKLPGRGLKIPNLQLGGKLAALGKKFKRRPGQTLGGGSRIGFKAFFGTFGLAALLPTFQSVWEAFAGNTRNAKGEVGVDIVVDFEGETSTEHVSQ